MKSWCLMAGRWSLSRHPDVASGNTPKADATLAKTSQSLAEPCSSQLLTSKHKLVQIWISWSRAQHWLWKTSGINNESLHSSVKHKKEEVELNDFGTEETLQYCWCLYWFPPKNWKPSILHPVLLATTSKIFSSITYRVYGDPWLMVSSHRGAPLTLLKVRKI